MIPEEDHGIVLQYAEKGEKFWSITFLSENQGLHYPLLRRSKNGMRPDLFDTGQAKISRAKQGGLIFFSEYHPLRRRSGIARSYEVLRIAARFSTILQRNAEHLPDPKTIFDLSEQFFNSLEKGPAPEASYLKALYLFARMEGLPIREDWVQQLGDGLRNDLETILKHPLEQQATDAGTSRTLSARLEHWLVGEAHFIIPR